MLSNVRVPLLGFVAHSNSGKTTLLERLLPLLRQQALRVGVVKHAPHGFDIDQAGKDSYRLREAGATQMLIASPQRWALITDSSEQPLTGLAEVLAHLDQRRLDCILVEGFKRERFPKIEVFRPSLRHSPLCTQDNTFIAVVSDGPLPIATSLPVLDFNDTRKVADFVYEQLARQPEASRGPYRW